jgi:nucleoside-diphosphate-sugar epimerase
MTVLVTGGNGFVMSNFVRHWIESDPAERVVVLDSATADQAAREFFAPVADRIRWVQASILEPDAWANQVAREEITQVVHGATLTPHPYLDADGSNREPEREGPRRILDVNVMGTVELLEWARSLHGLRRLLYVSTGSVYGNEGPKTENAPLPEEGYIDPTTLYGISKYASELIVRRWGQLFGLPVVSVRLSSVYGPMDRETASRHVRCVPWLVTHLALSGDELRVSDYDGVGDWIHAGDVAEAISRLVRAPVLRHSTYNVAYGRAETVKTLVEITAEKVPVRSRPSSKHEANVVCDPDRRRGQWGAYDISRLRDELSWEPLPLRQRMHDYIDWLRESEFAAGASHARSSSVS